MDSATQQDLRRVRFLPRRGPANKLMDLKVVELFNHRVHLHACLDEELKTIGYEVVVDGPGFFPNQVGMYLSKGEATAAFFDTVHVIHVKYVYNRITFASIREALWKMIKRNLGYLFKLFGLLAFGYFLDYLGVFDFFIEIFNNTVAYLGIEDWANQTVAFVVNFKQVAIEYFNIFVEKVREFNKGL